MGSLRRRRLGGKSFWSRWSRPDGKVWSFLDGGLTVEFLQDDGQIVHSHINPAYLEKFEPQKEDADYDVLLSASAIQKGKVGIEPFLMYLDWYQKRFGGGAGMEGNQ